MSYWDYKRGKRRWIRKCKVCGKKAKLSMPNSFIGNHPNQDKVWFQVSCTFCNTHSRELEGVWADEQVVKEWNSGDVSRDMAVKKLLKKKSKEQ